MGGTPILGMIGRFHSDDPCYWDFQSEWVPILYLNIIFLQKKIGLSLSHVVPEILRPKVGLIFHKSVFFLQILSICINFSIIFDPIDLLFH